MKLFFRKIHIYCYCNAPVIGKILEKEPKKRVKSGNKNLDRHLASTQKNYYGIQMRAQTYAFFRIMQLFYFVPYYFRKINLNVDDFFINQLVPQELRIRYRHYLDKDKSYLLLVKNVHYSKRLFFWLRNDTEGHEVTVYEFHYPNLFFTSGQNRTTVSGHVCSGL